MNLKDILNKIAGHSDGGDLHDARLVVILDGKQYHGTAHIRHDPRGGPHGKLQLAVFADASTVEFDVDQAGQPVAAPTPAPAPAVGSTGIPANYEKDLVDQTLKTDGVSPTTATAPVPADSTITATAGSASTDVPATTATASAPAS